VESVGGLPELFQHVEEIEHERNVREEGAYPLLQGPFPVGDDHPGKLVVRIAAEHLLPDPGDEGGLLGQQARPHALVPGLAPCLAPV